MCRACVRAVSARAEQGIRVRVRGKEVTKCYMRVTAPFPTQSATLHCVYIVPLLFQLKMQKRPVTSAIQTLHRDARQMAEEKILDKNCLSPPAAFFDGTEMRLRPP